MVVEIEATVLVFSKQLEGERQGRMEGPRNGWLEVRSGVSMDERMR